VRPSLRSVLRRGAGRIAAKPQSALIVPVPAAEPLVEVWRSSHDPSAALGMPAHVTILYPWFSPKDITPALEAELEELLSPFEAFRFSLAAVDRFPGVLYLAPEPAAPFVALTEAIARRWPKRPPYGGDYEHVVPHLTVAQGSEPGGAAEALEGELPLATEADCVLLMTQDRRTWSVRRRFPLGALPG
jgi:2'-5' RNA ligase